MIKVFTLFSVDFIKVWVGMKNVGVSNKDISRFYVCDEFAYRLVAFL
jgi:hypothetical protein